jgi:hypothetical protein
MAALRLAAHEARPPAALGGEGGANMAFGVLIHRFHGAEVQKVAAIAVRMGSRLATDSANSDRALQGYVHESVNQTQQEYARGEVHENRAECLCSLLTPSLRGFRGVSTFNRPGYVGFLQFLRNVRHWTACEQAELMLDAALDPAIASRARQGDFVKCLDHFNLLQTARN